MNKRQRDGFVFVLVGVAFLTIGWGTNAGSLVVWFVLAGAFALLGGQMLRGGDARRGRRRHDRGDRTS